MNLAGYYFDKTKRFWLSIRHIEQEIRLLNRYFLNTKAILQQ